MRFFDTAVRFYPNLNPRAVVTVNRQEIGTLLPFFGQYRVHRPDARGQMPPNARFVFVTDMQGAILMHPRYRHPVLANGQPVRYAGEAQFRHGRLQWWSNGSGNYRPDARDAVQAGLPMSNFVTHEQVRARSKEVRALESLARPAGAARQQNAGRL
ncbi:MAG TPA: hypothetical protein VG871_08845 [Vicinamibacterales bacterium]|nr:hypothetical protein [Vicinamibacterales bacterium]